MSIYIIPGKLFLNSSRFDEGLGNDEAIGMTTRPIVGRESEKIFSFETEMSENNILKQVTRSNCSLRCSKDCMLRIFSRSEYAISDNPGIRLVNFLWTASRVLIKFICEGFQTGDAYSRRGRTYIL